MGAWEKIGEAKEEYAKLMNFDSWEELLKCSSINYIERIALPGVAEIYKKHEVKATLEKVEDELRLIVKDSYGEMHPKDTSYFADDGDTVRISIDMSVIHKLKNYRKDE